MLASAHWTFPWTVRGDFGLRGMSISTHISTMVIPVDATKRNSSKTKNPHEAATKTHTSATY